MEIAARFQRTWYVLFAAVTIVLGVGWWISRTAIAHVFVPCRGTLEEVASSQLAHGARVPVPRSDLDVAYDVKQTAYPQSYASVRILWIRSDGVRACNELAVDKAVPAHNPSFLDVEQETMTGLYTVRDPKISDPSFPIIVFRRAESSSRRIDWHHVVDPHNLSFLIFLVAFGALGFGGYRLAQATPYGRTMFRWRAAKIREDGVVEGLEGVLLGRMEDNRWPEGDVIVEPEVVEDSDPFRSLPMLTRKTVGAGAHDRWLEGTMKRLRDAQTLAIIATAATALAALAHLIGD